MEPSGRGRRRGRTSHGRLAPAFDLTFTGTACKYPGNSGPIRKGYRFGVTTSHNAPYPIVLVVRSFTVNGVPASQVRF